MKRLLILAVLAIPLSGCAALGGQGTLDTLVKDLQGCSRHYDGAIGAGMTGTGFSGTVKIDCLPANAPVPTPSA